MVSNSGSICIRSRRLPWHRTLSWCKRPAINHFYNLHIMKKISFILVAVMAHSMLSAQFAGIQNNQEQPLPGGFKPASTNTFLSQYPAVNAETRQATFRV